MSNSKVRKQIEAQEAKGKLLEVYKKKSDFILDYQVCKAYFKDSALSIMTIVEKILKAKYNLPWQEKIIRKVLMENRGKSNPTIAIPQFRYEKKVHDIISEFVYRNFDKMVTDRKKGEIYPIKFMDIVDENS
jgi:phenolic acid decarboxylase